MIRPMILIPFLALLGTATSISAQETADGTTQAESEPQGQVILDTGEPVPEPNAPGQSYTREKSGDWDIQCLRVEEGQEEPCQMYQLLLDENGNSVAETSLFRLEGNGQVVAGGTFVVPLETLLTQKMTVQVDGGQAKRYDFSLCNEVGCYSRVGFTQADINSFKKGALAKVTIVPALAPDQKVTLTMSLSGFTNGFEMTTPIKR